MKCPVIALTGIRIRISAALSYISCFTPYQGMFLILLNLLSAEYDFILLTFLFYRRFPALHLFTLIFCDCKLSAITLQLLAAKPLPNGQMLIWMF